MNPVVLLEEFVLQGILREQGDIDLSGFFFELLFRHHPRAVTPDGEQERSGKQAGNDFPFQVDLAFVDGERQSHIAPPKTTPRRTLSFTNE